MSTYSRASKAVWFEDEYLGSVMDPNAGVFHTTEGTSMPSYSGGATAPNYTAKPSFRRKRLKFFAHFSDERSSRALRNSGGGVETNTLNVIQLELIGTCDPRTSKAWTKAGRKHIFWPNPPAWALRDLAHFLVDMHKRHGIPIAGPKDWAPYPRSYGAGGQRFSFREWREFYGWCGHQHVPENTHGDPGNFPWERLEAMAKDLLEGKAEAPRRPRRSPRWDDVWERADRFQESLHSTARARRRALEKIKDLAADWSVSY